MTKKIKIPTTLQTRATFQPETFDAEKRTVDIIWSTGKRVKRFQWFGPDYYEELSMSPAHIRMDRFKNGANVLNNHSNHDLRNIIGVIEKASVKDGEGHATIRLADTPDVADIVRKVQDGIIRNLSVGYKVHKYKKIKEEKRSDDDSEEETIILRAIDWEPMEVSFVCIPADEKSQVRNENNSNDSFEVEVDDELNNEGEIMKNRSAKGGKPQEEVKPSQVDSSSDNSSDKGAGDAGSSESSSEGSEKESEKKPAGGHVPTSNDGDKPADKRSEIEIRKEENERRKGIISAVRLAGLGDDFAETLIDDVNMSMDKARAEIFKKLETSQPETRNNKIEVRNMDNALLRREATVRGILHRSNPEQFKLKDGDSEFVQPSLLMTARHYLSQELGQRDAYTISDVDVAKRALHHTSDFPLLLADVSNKSLRAGYESVPSTYELFTRINTGVTNFKDINSYEVSKGGMLRKVNEHGEYERGSLVESGEKYRVEKYGLIIGKTWELMVNDELGAFTNTARDLGIRAREMENKVFWDLILANPLMADGYAFFSAQHGNLSIGGAAALGETPLSKARAAMRVMKDLDGELISVNSKYLVVPAALETAADKLLASVTPAAAADVQVFSGKLTPVVEPRLDAASATAYYTFADKARLATAEMARLNNAGPEIFTREGFDIDGMEVKIRYVFGMKLINYRAAQKNVGA